MVGYLDVSGDSWASVGRVNGGGWSWGEDVMQAWSGVGRRGGQPHVHTATRASACTQARAVMRTRTHVVRTCTTRLGLIVDSWVSVLRVEL